MDGITKPFHVETPESWEERRSQPPESWEERRSQPPETICGGAAEYLPNNPLSVWGVYNFTDAMNLAHGIPHKGVTIEKPPLCRDCMGIISEEYG